MFSINKLIDTNKIVTESINKCIINLEKEFGVSKDRIRILIDPNSDSFDIHALVDNKYKRTMSLDEII